MLKGLPRALLLTAALALAACNGPGGKTGETAATDKASQPAADPAKAGPDDMVMGKADAPVTLIEYASVACPVCAMVHTQILPDIEKKYVDTGQVKLIFREFPTHAPALAYVGEMVARCTAEKKGDSAYFTVVDTLFETQHDWVDGDDPEAALQKIASQAGLDDSAFKACIHRQDLVDLVNQMVNVAEDRYGVNATPTFILNGEKMGGFNNTEDFEKQLDAALAKASGTEKKS